MARYLLIDDILRSGRTLSYAKELMYEARRAQLRSPCCSTSAKRKTDLEADYVGFECPDYLRRQLRHGRRLCLRSTSSGIVTGDADA